MANFNEHWMAARKEAGGSVLFTDFSLLGDVGHDDILRRAGGGGIPISKPMGVMLLLLLGFSIVAYSCKQGQMISAMLVGFIFGATSLDSAEPYLQSEVIFTFIELGEILTLFFTGLTVDFDAFSRYLWPRIIIATFWRSVLLAGLLALIGWSSGLCVSAATISFFGICGTLSSKAVLGLYLDFHGTHELHVKIAKGMAFCQDAILCCCLVVSNAFERAAVIPCSLPSVRGCTSEVIAGQPAEKISFTIPDGVTWSFETLGDEIYRSIGIFVLALCIFYVLSKHVLGRAFRFFVKDSEMLFIGSMGWALGAAAIAYQVGWSMPVAAYLAGLSLSFKSCRVQVLNKIGFLHIVNRFIFFFMLGIYVRLSPGFFTTMRHGYASNFAWSLVCSFVVVVGSPVFTCVASIYRGYTERTAFYSSMLVNSMGGTALIFALQCHKSGIFNLEVLAVLVVAVWLSSVFSSLFQNVLPKMHGMMKGPIATLKERVNLKVKKHQEKREAQTAFKGHIVILGFNEVGVELAEFYRARKTDVLCIDLDPDLYDTFLQAYKGTKPKAPGKLPPSLRLRGTSRLGSRSLPRPAEVLPSMPFANLGFPRQVSAVPSQALYSPVPVNMSNIPIVGRAFGMHTSDDEASEYEIGETSIISAQNFGNMPFPGFPMFPYPDIQNVRTDEEKAFTVDGRMYGCCTNIFPIYADPEDPQTWAKYNLPDASLVVACMPDRLDSCEALCEFLQHSRVPSMVACNSNQEAKKLYEKRCTYVVQQDFLASKEVSEMLELELRHRDSASRHGQGHEVFLLRSEDHKQELHEEKEDFVQSKLGEFI